MARPLDHLVLPTADLEIARERLGRLGFTVAPRGVHPFGTENCCVYFEGGTFIEPLAVADEAAAAAAAKTGNVFVARDRFYRESFGPEGFSAVVFGSEDADDDHRRYVESGISAGDRLDFSRPFVDASGKSDIASFRLAFAAEPGMRGTFVFACQRVNAPRVDRAALQAHANGATGIAEIVAVSGDPAGMADFLRVAADADGSAANGSGILELPNARIATLTPDRYSQRFGLPCDPHGSLAFAAVVFSVRDITFLRTHLASGNIDHDMRGNRIVAAAAPGQGAAFIFEEHS
ncbi:VOC family protein [Aquamicrobium terrae]|uniref:Glyoxalase-like domain-containing protein n=1 Tax=Aquamicrobium terrae TaxID=1324945 RepID=A0ABV2MTT7_9HYPH